MNRPRSTNSRPALLLVLVLLPAPALAHHSGARYDIDRTVVVQGVVKAWRWTNPHAELELAAQDGRTVWSLECSTPGLLARRGWSGRSLKPGDRVTVALHPLRQGAEPEGLVARVTTAAGAVLRDHEY